MEFLHDGRPPVVREAMYTPPAVEAADRIPHASAANRSHGDRC